MGTEIQTGPTGARLLADRAASRAERELNRDAQKNRPTGPQPAPVVQHLLVRYAKRGRMRFASHRDVGRAFERAVRQAGAADGALGRVQPAPEDSYASGTPTGVSSEAEYLTLALTATADPAECGRYWTGRCRTG